MPFGGFAPLPIRLGGSAEEGLNAAQFQRITADLCAARRTADFAVMVISQNLSSPFLLWYVGQNGVGPADYPTIVFSTSRDRITFPQFYVDGAGKRSRLVLRGAVGAVSDNVGSGRVQVDAITTPNEIVCRPVTADGTLLQTGAIFTLKVF